MELNTYQKEAFDYQRKNIETYGKRAWGWSIFYVICILVGLYALYLQIAKGPVSYTHLDNRYRFDPGW